MGGDYRPLPAAFFRRDAETVARELLGRYLVRLVGGKRLVVRLVETEAYLGVEDPASHSYAGRRTARTEPMFLAGGAAYVYLIYGMHHCMNVVTGRLDEAGAVLLRAAEPIVGDAAMLERRGLARPPRPGDVAGGPGKLCQALSIDRSWSGRSLLAGELRVSHGVVVPSEDVVVGPRVGVDYAGEAARWPLRFAMRSSRHVSKPPVER